MDKLSSSKGVVTDGNSNFYAHGSVYDRWMDDPIEAVNQVGRCFPEDWPEYSYSGKVPVNLFATNAKQLDNGFVHDDHDGPAKSILLGCFFLVWQPPVPFVNDDDPKDVYEDEVQGYWKLSEEDEKKILKALFLVSADTLVNHFETREVWHKGQLVGGWWDGLEKSGAITQDMVVAEKEDSAK